MTIRRVPNYRDEPTDVGDLLPWAYLIAPGVVVNKNASFLTTFRYRGPDLDSATHHELMSMAARQNNLLRRLGDGWFFFVDAQRVPSTAYPPSEHFPDPLTYLIDEERRAVFESGTHYETEYFFTLGWLPPKAGESSARQWFFTDPEGKRKESDARDRETAEDWLQTFQNERMRMLLQFMAILPECHALDDTELLTYLHDTISTKRHPVIPGDVSQELCRVLPDTTLVGGREPRLGRHYLGVVTVRQLPPSTVPGLLDRLNRLDMAFRWVTRWVALDKLTADKEIKKVRREWFSGRKSIGVVIKELMSNAADGLENPEAVANAADAEAAMQEIAAEAVSYGYLSQTLIVLDTDQRRLEQKVSLIEREINGLGFTTVNEVRDGNALDAFLGAVPGNCQHNIRRPMVSTLNLAHAMPSSAVWAGPRYCQSDLYPPKSPAHLYAVTNGSTPFRLSTFVGDVGHTIVIGPTGAGKSVLLNVLEAQFRRYDNAQVYIFDKGGSSRVLTEACGGTFYDLGGAGSPAFQPLSRIDSEHERAWAQDWIVDICVAEGLQMNPERKRSIWMALTSLATAPAEQRTMTGFNILVQDTEVKAALQPFTHDGAHGHLLDASHDDLSLGSWLAFEMEELMQTKSVVMPVLSYLFHRLEQRFTGAPSLLVLDEAWLFLDNPAFAEKIREWLKVLRKANVAVIFATQSLADVGQSKIVPTLVEACMTKIYLPNREARNDKIAEVYHQFGLNEKQLEILMTATPKSDYYLTSPLGNRLFSLGLGPLALAFCAATGKETQREVMALRREHPDTRAFLEAYLASIVNRTRPERGTAPLQWALDFIRTLNDERAASAAA